MPIQATVVLDSGSILTNLHKSPSLVEVGYFQPAIFIYGDGDQIAEIDPAVIGTGGNTVEIYEMVNDKKVVNNIKISHSLLPALLALSDIYEKPIPFDRKKYHCTFQLSSGLLCPSITKIRKFKEVDLESGQPTGKFWTSPRIICHDLNLYTKLQNNHSLNIVMNGEVLWSSSNSPSVYDRFDIQILADHATAEMYYKEALILDGPTCWLPNQGDPPPIKGGQG